MLLKLKPEQLRPGMYVILPSNWLHHPFLKNSFLLRNRQQIEKIMRSGFEEVMIDTSKGISMPLQESEQAALLKGGEASEENAPEESENASCEPESIVPEILNKAVASGLGAEEKARIIYWSSLEIMGKLFADPRAEKIAQAKKGIFQVVDAVFSEDMATHLIKLFRHDLCTYTHSVNVGMLSILLAKSFFKGQAGHNFGELGAGFFLHDIGKSRIDPGIINKPGLLTESEWEQMKAHPKAGYDLLLESGQLTEESRVIVMQHHERENGSGYPMGLKGSQIFPYARICRMADVFDALTSTRPYHKKRSAFEALNLMKKSMCFKDELFTKFVRLFGDGAN